MPTPRTFTVNFLGDVMLGRLIDQLFPPPNNTKNTRDAEIATKFKTHYPSLTQYTHKSPWGTTLPLLHSSDLNLLNLETAITTSPTPWPNKAFNYRMHPANTILTLKEAGVDYVNLANNHTLDFGDEGLVESVWVLKRMRPRVRFSGAGESSVEAFEPAVLRLPNTRVQRGRKGEQGRQGDGVDSDSERDSERDREYIVHVYSATDHPREWAEVPTFHMIDYSAASRERLKRVVLTKHPRNNNPNPNPNPNPTHSPQKDIENNDADLKIFSIHWGPNYTWHPHPSIKKLAHFLIDECGIDIVHGHSSHHIQGVEIYKGKLIMYGCGDFVDDYRVNTEYRNDLGGVWRLSLSESLSQEGSGDSNPGDGSTSTGDSRDGSSGDSRGKLKPFKLEIFPTRIDMFQAMLLDRDDPDHAWVREKLGALSLALGTTSIREELGDEGQIIVDLG